MEGRRRVRAEKGGEPLTVGQSWRAGAVGQLGDRKNRSNTVTETERSRAYRSLGRVILLKVLPGITRKHTSITCIQIRALLFLLCAQRPLMTTGSNSKQERQSQQKRQRTTETIPALIFSFSSTPHPSPLLASLQRMRCVDKLCNFNLRKQKKKIPAIRFHENVVTLSTITHGNNHKMI